MLDYLPQAADWAFRLIDVIHFSSCKPWNRFELSPCVPEHSIVNHPIEFV